MDKIKMILLILLLSVSVNAFLSAADETKMMKATVTDNSGESTNVYNLNLSEWVFERYNIMGNALYRWDSYNDLAIKKGMVEMYIPFKNIDWIEFDWKKNSA